jgi:hypothetical protein
LAPPMVSTHHEYMENNGLFYYTTLW